MPPLIVSARLSSHITIEPHSDGAISAAFDGHSIVLGKFSSDAAHRAQGLRKGIPLDAFTGGKDKDIERLVHRLAQHGLLEYRLTQDRDARDLAVIEPQMADYFPRTAKLDDADVVALSRFAYLRRRGNAMVLESPRAGALLRICDPAIAGALALLATPQSIRTLRRQAGLLDLTLLGLLADCQLIFKTDVDAKDDLRAREGDDNFVLWDFHDLLFHTHSTEGRQANPLGGLYPYAEVMKPPPAVRPRWPGKKVDLRKLADTAATMSPVAALLRARHSTREFDDTRPITLAELARFLDGAARVQSKWKSRADLGDGGPMISYATRPYPAAGASYELELYLAVTRCEGLAPGFYHYDADAHALTPIPLPAPEFEAWLASAAFAMDAATLPQILVTIAARFDRMAWKYSSIAYSLILKDVGVLTQTLYLMATDIGLGGCAIGSINIDLFAKITGIAFHVEGPVGQFAMGRGFEPER